MTIQAEDKATFTTPTPSEFRSFHAQVGTANAPVSLTVEAPTAGGRNTFLWVHWSYNGVPTNGQLTITDGVTTETIYITSSGPGFLPLSGAAFSPNAQVTFTLTAGGAAISGTLSVLGARKI